MNNNCLRSTPVLQGMEGWQHGRIFPKLKKRSVWFKAGRYTGGEPGCTYKDKANVDVRMAFCFPDTYEIGMSFLGEKILLRSCSTATKLVVWSAPLCPGWT